MEKKYIEISEAIEYFRTNQGRDGYRWGDIAICLQHSIPAADVVPVVLCYDCKSWELSENRCKRLSDGDGNFFCNPDFYCAYGQRREK